MADTDWNLHSKQLITPTDNDRMLVEPSDETAKAVEVGGFRNWLMSTALFNTLTTTAKTILGAIEEIKGKVEDNTTQLNAKVNKSNINNTLLVTEEGSVLDARQGKILKDEMDKKALKISTLTYKLYVADNADFNNLLETGIYQIADATNMTNIPTIASWSILEVIATNSYVKQTITNVNTGKMWVRILSSTWSAWREV